MPCREQDDLSACRKAKLNSGMWPISEMIEIDTVRNMMQLKSAQLARCEPLEHPATGGNYLQVGRTSIVCFPLELPLAIIWVPQNLPPFPVNQRATPTCLALLTGPTCGMHCS